MFQTSLRKEFSFFGIGLHSGKNIFVRVMPAPPDTGIQFCRTDVVNCPFVRISPFNVTFTQLATTISCGDFPISTVEHLTSALYGLGVDNAYIDVGGPEVPILDGSAAPIASMIAEAGITHLGTKRKYLTIVRPVEIEIDDKLVRGSVSDDFEITFEIDYQHKAICCKKRFLALTPELYFHTVANSRTFGFQKDVEMLWKMGLAKGGSLDNAIVLDDNNGILNEGGLRHSSEFVSHKILDIIGDVSLIGYRILGHIYAVKSGHHVNNLFARRLIESMNSYRISEVEKPDDGYGYFK
ncbi:MAG: UDP-3-O-acyl-N-acetylglucosamine deacetylase [Deferribacteraceae bacterium]|nr:UDP-3-O-acyl-N-acetylglucosamine deacetylase [Deferribacteraceae bacterium]